MQNRLVWLGGVLVALSAAGAACSDDGQPSGGGGPGGSGSGAGSTTSATGGGSTTSSSGGGTTSASGGGGGAQVECAAPADCDAALGAAPCGVWACNAGNCEASATGCVDADQDGYGTGVGCTCAGLDCDDTDDAIGSSAIRGCYSGPTGTSGVGMCEGGSQACAAGAWGPCIGEIVPSGEACNGQDDDCDGTPDDNLGMFSCGLGVCAKTVTSCVAGAVGACVPAVAMTAVDGPSCNGLDDDCDGAVDEDCKSCIPVSLNGNDATADGTFANPFLSVQAAIDWAATHAGPKSVCVAAGAACGATGTYPNVNGATITMANGVALLGNYESTTWNRCNNSTTVLQPRTAEGVTFPATVVTATVLDGFRIDRFNSATTAGITVNGAKLVSIGNVTISNTPTVSNSYGVNVINGGEATLTKNRIDAGNGTTESMALRVVGSKVRLTANCASLDAFGRCDDFCGGNPSLRGSLAQGTGTTYAAYLEDSPGSIIESSALCANDADVGAAIRIVGDATGDVIRGNTVNAFGGATSSHGIWMEDCDDAAPWIVDNHYIAAAGDSATTSVDAIRAMGACHPVIDSNVEITGGGEGQAASPNGVHCGAVGNVASQCVVLGNKLIEGSEFGFPPVAVGVRCELDGCARVSNNTITGRGGVQSYGLWLESTTAVVDSNLIRGGCSATTVGVRAADAASRIQNNRIHGFTSVDCVGNPAVSASSIGLQVLLAASQNELDVHSNDIDGSGAGASCTSIAISLGVGGTPPTTGTGIYRNNIILAGVCGLARYGVAEVHPAADPRVFENDDISPTGSPTALYLDENTSALASETAINALVDMTVSGVIAQDPLFVLYPTNLHLSIGSPCEGAGTPTGSPTRDFEGDGRDPAMPDIGADEL